VFLIGDMEVSREGVVFYLSNVLEAVFKYECSLSLVEIALLYKFDLGRMVVEFIQQLLGVA
jgi:hypothetical protein